MDNSTGMQLFLNVTMGTQQPTVDDVTNGGSVTENWVSEGAVTGEMSTSGSGDWNEGWGEERHQIRDVAMRSIYIILGSLGIVGNAVVVIVLFSMTSMRKKVTNLFIIHQSVVDFLTAIFVLMTTILPDDGRRFLSVGDDVYCRLWVGRIPLWMCIHVSTYNLVALTLERYFSVVYPVLHKISFTHTKAFIAIGVEWSIGFLWDLVGSLPTGKISEGNCMLYLFPSMEMQKAVGVFGLCLNYFVPIIILIYCYSRMAWSLQQKIAPMPAATAPQAGAVRTAATGTGSHAPHQGPGGHKQTLHARGKRNIIKTLAIVATVFILCLSWNQVFFFLYNLGLFDYRALQGNYYHFSVAAMFASCCTNPFIYTAKYEEFQKGIRKLFCRKGDKVGANADVSGVNHTISTNAT